MTPPPTERGIAQALAVPRLYSWFANLIGGDSRSTYVREYIRPLAGQRIVDIGCGPADIVSELPHGVDYVGIDKSARYIDAARTRFGDRAKFYCQPASADPAFLGSVRFDIAMANGVLHHLDDTQALELLELARDLLASGGRLVTLDGCYVPAQPAIARLLLRLDRGKHVRAPEAYLSLARKAFRRVEPHVREDLLRTPYTHLIMECWP